MSGGMKLSRYWQLIMVYMYDTVGQLKNFDQGKPLLYVSKSPRGGGFLCSKVNGDVRRKLVTFSRRIPKHGSGLT